MKIDIFRGDLTNISAPQITMVHTRYCKNELEERVLLNLSKKGWTHGLTLEAFNKHQVRSPVLLFCKGNEMFIGML